MTLIDGFMTEMADKVLKHLPLIKSCEISPIYPESIHE